LNLFHHIDGVSLSYRCSSGKFFIAAFDRGRQHFKPFVSLYRVAGMGRNDDGLPGLKHAGLVIDHNFGLPVNDLNERVKTGDFFRHRLTGIACNGTDVSRCPSHDGFDHYRIGNILEKFGNHESFRFFKLGNFHFE